MPEHIAEDMPSRMPEDMPEDMPDRMPEDMPEKMPEDMSDRMPEDLPVTKRINVMVGITRSKVIYLFSQLFYFFIDVFNFLKSGIILVGRLTPRISWLSRSSSTANCNASPLRRTAASITSRSA